LVWSLLSILDLELGRCPTYIRPVLVRQGSEQLERQLEEHRGALTTHCTRILGSAFEADDAVQDTLVRAWRAFDRFEGRASLRTWLHSIATNVCLDMLRSSQRRARPIDLAPPPAGAYAGDGRSGVEGIRPIPSTRASRPIADPAEQVVTREAVRCAFVAALMRLPPRQRSVLILRDVLRWEAAEVAELLGTTATSVNSALQRARSTLAARHPTADASYPGADRQGPLLQRYVDAFERYDLDSLVSLLQRAVPPPGAGS
jgi:RNA polymerase sigma-70 factor (ECF subfamily)